MHLNRGSAHQAKATLRGALSLESTAGRLRFTMILLAFVVFGGKSYEVLLRGIDSNIHGAVAMSVTANTPVEETSGTSSASTTARESDSSSAARPGKVGLRLPIPIRNFTSPAAPLAGVGLGSSASSGQSSEPSFDANRYFNDHPFLYFWFNGLIMRGLGPDAFSARLLTLFSSVGCVWVLFEILKTGLGLGAAFMGALLLISCRDFVLTAATMSLDPPMILAILLTFFAWLRRRTALVGIFAGVGLWIKTPVVLLIYPAALITIAARALLRWGARSQRPSEVGGDPSGVENDGAPGKSSSAWRPLIADLKRLAVSAGISVALGAAFWGLVARLGGWAMVEDYWRRQLLGTAVGGRAGGSDFSWTFVFENLRTGFLPGIILMPFAAYTWIRSSKVSQEIFLLPVSAFFVFAAVLGGMKYKVGSYYTPIFPLAAWVTSVAFYGWIAERIHKISDYAIRGVLLLAVFLLVAPVPLAPEAFVALRRFTPLIQFNGSCSDRVLLVQGGEPVGSSLDYQMFLNFYSAREVKVAPCGGVAEFLRRRENIPEWVILSDENYRNCLTAVERSYYPYRVAVGAQLLLRSEKHLQRDSRFKDGVVDLTPLEASLKAVTDCRPPELPQDRWHRY